MEINIAKVNTAFSKFKDTLSVLKNFKKIKLLEPDYKVIDVKEKNSEYIIYLQITGKNIISKMPLSIIQNDSLILNGLIDSDKTLLNNLFLQSSGIFYKIIGYENNLINNNIVFRIAAFNNDKVSILNLSSKDIIDKTKLNKYSIKDQNLLRVLLPENTI